MTQHGDGRTIRSKGKARKRKTWRDVPDDVLCNGQARLQNGKLEFAPVEHAESPCPSQNTLEGRSYSRTSER